MVKRSKPAPDIYLEACRRLQARPEDSCAVEDSYNGIRAAHAAGMKPIMVPDLAEPTEEMEIWQNASCLRCMRSGSIWPDREKSERTRTEDNAENRRDHVACLLTFVH